MAYPKKEFPNFVIGLLRTDKGYSVCEFLVNEERRIKFIDVLPPDMLSIALERARRKLIKHSRGESSVK